MSTSRMSEAIRSSLGLEDEHMDEDLGLTLTSLVASAVRDENAIASLGAIYDAVQKAECTGSLEPLTLVPLLVPSPKNGATQLLHLMCAQCSPKECVMAAQEVVEHLQYLVQSGELEEQNEQLSPLRQLEKLMQIYVDCIQRMPRRKKTPSETIAPIFSELASLLSDLSGHGTSAEAESMLCEIAKSLLSLSAWATEVATSAEDKAQSLGCVYDLLRAAVDACSNSLRTSCARAAFAHHYSRLLLPGQDGPSASNTDAIGSNVWALLDALGRTTVDLETQPSLCSLILLAHRPGYSMSLATLQTFFPIILPSAQGNVALDETLYLLITTITPLRSQTPRLDLSQDLVLPLVHVLPHLAGIHPDPATRHQTFRLLSTVLALTPSPLRLHLLQELMTDEESSPQMRVAAVGLVREAALEALETKPGSAESTRNAFLSPMFLHRLGPLLLRASPPDLFGLSDLQLDDFMHTPEPLRLVECMTLIYTLLQRDTDNRTGIRDRSTLQSFKTFVLLALHSKLSIWNKEIEERVTGGEHVMLQLASDAIFAWSATGTRFLVSQCEAKARPNAVTPLPWECHIASSRLRIRVIAFRYDP